MIRPAAPPIILAFLALLCGPALAQATQFGVVAAEDLPSPDDLIPRARQLGAQSVRPPVVWVDRWITGRSPCAADDCARWTGAGLPLVLVIRANGQFGRPTTPPKDLAAFRKTVGQILDSYRPALLVVEDEENTIDTYSDGTRPGEWDSPRDGIDTADAYVRELEAACQTAHARKIACTDGGLSGDAVAAAQWVSFMRKDHAAHACSLARRAFDGGEQMCRLKKIDQAAPARLQQAQRVDRLLALFRRSSVDYVNVHWDQADDESFGWVLDYVRTASGKPVVSTRISPPTDQVDAQPEITARLLDTAARQSLVHALWQLADRPAPTEPAAAADSPDAAAPDAADGDDGPATTDATFAEYMDRRKGVR